MWHNVGIHWPLQHLQKLLHVMVSLHKKTRCKLLQVVVITLRIHGSNGTYTDPWMGWCLWFSCRYRYANPMDCLGMAKLEKHTPRFQSMMGSNVGTTLMERVVEMLDHNWQKWKHFTCTDTYGELIYLYFSNTQTPKLKYSKFKNISESEQIPVYLYWTGKHSIHSIYEKSQFPFILLLTRALFITFGKVNVHRMDIGWFVCWFAVHPS